MVLRNSVESITDILPLIFLTKRELYRNKKTGRNACFFVEIPFAFLGGGGL